MVTNGSTRRSVRRPAAPGRWRRRGLLALALLVAPSAVGCTGAVLEIEGCRSTMAVGDQLGLGAVEAGTEGAPYWHVGGGGANPGAAHFMTPGGAAADWEGGAVELRAIAPGNVVVTVEALAEEPDAIAVALGYLGLPFSLAVGDRCAIAILASEPVGVVHIADRDFDPADWAVTEQATNGATQSARQEGGGGSGGYRRMVHALPPESTIAVTHLYLGETYDPATQGAIERIDYREDRIEFDPPFPGAAVAGRFVLVQDGQVFVYTPDPLAFTATDWQTLRVEGLTAADFATDGAQPDFSAAGAPLRFGFIRANSNTSATNAAVIDHGIDDWIVTIHPVGETAA
jgi:hypothetical protein